MWCEFVWPMMIKIHCLIFITFLTYKMNTIHIASFSLELVISWFIFLRSAVALILTVIAGGGNYRYIQWYHDWWIIANLKILHNKLKSNKSLNLLYDRHATSFSVAGVLHRDRHGHRQKHWEWPGGPWNN